MSTNNTNDNDQIDDAAELDDSQLEDVAGGWAGQRWQDTSDESVQGDAHFGDVDQIDW